MSGVTFERRGERRVDVPATAIVVKGGADAGRFLVQNLSATGALLTGGDAVRVGDSVLLRLEVMGHRPVVIQARVLRRASASSDVTALAVEFRHRSPDTEDAIQQVVLDALEDAVKSEPFFKDAEFYE
jgi:PilZ domain